MGTFANFKFKKWLQNNSERLAPLLIILIVLSVVGVLSLWTKIETIKNEQPPRETLTGNQSNKLSTNSAKIDEQPSYESKSFCLYVPVFYYHHIEPADLAKQEGHTGLNVDVNSFEAQMKYLADGGYQTINAEVLPAALLKHLKIPGKSVMITIDDGYSDAYSFAFPIAKKYSVKLNLFIITGLLGDPDYLTWSELKEMVDSGLVYVYDHTVTHSSLTSDNSEKIRSEIVDAKAALEQHLGRPVNILTYPYGSYNQKVIDIVKENGFIGAYSTVSSFQQCESFTYSLHRTRGGAKPLSAYGL